MGCDRMAERIPPEVQELVKELEEVQAKFTATANQRAVIEGELSEINRILEALEEMKDDAKVYRNVGNILFEEDRSKLIEELKEKKETNELLLQRYKKEEEKLKERIQYLQDKLKELLSKHMGKMAGVTTIQGASS